MIDWNVASALGSCLSALAAVVGLFFVGVQIRGARRATDLQTLVAFLHDVREHEGALALASDEASKDKAFFEYLNLLETYASAVNANLLSSFVRRSISEKISDALSAIEYSSHWHTKVETAVTSHSALSDLRKFIENHRLEINAGVRARQARFNMAAAHGST